MWPDLTIVTSCTNYGSYLPEWTASIIAQTIQPGRVCIFTHGTAADDIAGGRAVSQLMAAQIPAIHVHRLLPCENFGAARNHAVALAESEWVLHLDTDDTLMPHAIATCHALADDADVISAGYERSGRVTSGMSTRGRVYDDLDGVLALDANALCSSNSPFRKSFWRQSPYRTDMLGAWDTAFWIGLAHLGARFRATPRPIFFYRQHADSVFATRQKAKGWARVHTTAMLSALRRAYHGVSVIVPRDYTVESDRAANWTFVEAHYRQHHPEWTITQGYSASDEWCKGAAIQRALNHSTADVLVIADADCIVDPSALEAAVYRVRDGAPWAMPHTLVRRLSALGTSRFLHDGPDYRAFEQYPLHHEPYEGASGGGIVVIKRQAYDAIGGIPLAFQGWGSEDRAFGLLCDTLLGPCVRDQAELLHLYHAPQSHTRSADYNLQLLRRLGQAALNGKDALVLAVAALPKTRTPLTISSTRPVRTIAQMVDTDRRTSVVRKYRRIP